ncbi:conserved protein of unknown function [Candidatus Hydrogenisulfobacillus filiaventi]|uniref:HAD family hydrolase n=1 Tax=Candidatus Hydrogenisulfobacillus filiaventi TaxID=2707344 RepID=A0A6F8ZKH0_9FIRM|nr:HAD family hydrolase [Bacillota bacterium]CAB1130102.1 conserved protein of unknown function [Candidatus Hydrogenisulfobacillus filiaventi]
MAVWVGIDLDGTLLDHPYWHLHLSPWLTRTARRHGLDRTALWQRLQAESRRRWRAGDWLGAMDWAAMAAGLGLHLPDPGRPPAGAVSRLVMPGADRLLLHWTARGLRLVLVSNGLWRNQRPYLEALGWLEVFAGVVTPDRTGVAKPDPRAFAAAGRPLAWHLGDQLYQDVLGARRAGVPAMQILHLVQDAPLDPLAPQRVAPDLTVEDLEQARVLGLLLVARAGAVRRLRVPCP